MAKAGPAMWVAEPWGYDVHACEVTSVVSDSLQPYGS